MLDEIEWNSEVNVKLKPNISDEHSFRAVLLYNIIYLKLWFQIETTHLEYFTYR